METAVKDLLQVINSDAQKITAYAVLITKALEQAQAAPSVLSAKEIQAWLDKDEKEHRGIVEWYRKGQRIHDWLTSLMGQPERVADIPAIAKDQFHQKTQPTSWEQAVMALEEACSKAIRHMARAGEPTDGLILIEASNMAEQAFNLFRQSLAALPGITEQDLDDLLNIVSPDVFVKRISTLKGKLGQPAPDVTVGQAAEWWATHTGYPNESSRIKAFLSFLHPDGGQPAQVLSVEDIRQFFIRHQENWSELFNRGDGQRGAKLFYDFLVSHMGTVLPLTHESEEVQTAIDRFFDSPGDITLRQLVERLVDDVLTLRGNVITREMVDEIEVACQGAPNTQAVMDMVFAKLGIRVVDELLGKKAE
ncbi:MAG: hypothetical protein WC749_10360 [Dehalococcoidia bacterium]